MGGLVDSGQKMSLGEIGGGGDGEEVHLGEGYPSLIGLFWRRYSMSLAVGGGARDDEVADSFH